MAVKILHKHSNVEFKSATGAQLEYGELAVNYHESGPYLQCKDAAGEVVQLGGVFFGEDADPPGEPLPGKWWLNSAGKLYLFNGASWVEITGTSSGGGGGGSSITVLGGDGINANTIGSTVTLTADLDQNRGLDIEGNSIAIKIGANLSFDADGKLQADSGGLSYKGLCDVTSSAVVSNPSPNDLYSNTGTGKFSSQWAAVTENADTSTDAGEGDLVAFDGSEWNLLPRSSSSVGTDLGIADLDGTDFVITSSTGADAKLPPATKVTAGVMTAADKTKLDAQVEVGDGALIIKDSDGNEVGTFTANQATGTDTEINLPEGFSGDYKDLTNKPTIPDVNDGKVTIVDADGGAVGEFTVNQAGDTEITLPEIPETTGFVKLDDEGTEQSIVGGGGLDVVGGIKSEFGTNAAQLGNVAPLNDWSCYPARPTTFYAPPAPPPPPSPSPEPVDPDFGVDVPTFSGGVVGSGGLSSTGTMDVIDLGDA